MTAIKEKMKNAAVFKILIILAKAKMRVYQCQTELALQRIDFLSNL